MHVMKVDNEDKDCVNGRLPHTLYASVTQLDRVSDYESESRRFESYSTYHF